MSKETKNNQDLLAVNKICAGIDVHRDSLSVTLIIETPSGDINTEFRMYSTFNLNLLEMRDWLVSQGCTVAGMESTGKYWFTTYFVLENVMDVYVYNAKHLKTIPGKKTDRRDSAWIANVVRHNMLVPSYIPDKQIRDARLLSRTRKSLVQHRGSVRQRILGLLDSAGIKLSSVVSDVFGASGRNLLTLLKSGEPITAKRVERIVFGPLRDKVDKLLIAMQGYLHETHIYLIEMEMGIETMLTNRINEIEAKLMSFLIDTDSKREALEKVVLIPGFSERSAMLLLSEVGFDLKTFPSIKNFCSWAGLAPGKKESAGKNLSGKIQVRQRYLRSLFIEIALAATRCKDTFIQSKYYALKSRIGGKKAVVAIAHLLAEAAYRAIKERLDYRELTSKYVSLNQMNKDIRHLVKITDRLGKDAIIALMNVPEITIN